MKEIDVHVHYYPPEYLERLEKLNTQFKIGTNANGQKILFDRGSRIVTLTETMANIEERLADMEKVAPGVIQALSLSIPNVHLEDAGAAVELAKLANESYAELRAKYPDNFLCLASVPLPHVDAAIAELERALINEQTGVATS